MQSRSPTPCLGVLLAILAPSCAQVPAVPATGEEVTGKTPPNFVVFLADDLGWGDLSCYGHPVMKTPNLDAFARQGMKFNQCYAACPVCSPSRSAILTGRTPYRNGVFTWLPAGTNIHLRKSEITVAALLKARGYATCHVGKWHLNGKFNAPEQPQPNDHGYDWWLATQNNAAPNHKNPKNFVRNGELVGEMAGYSAVLIADEAVRWLEKERDKTKPFFLSVWTHEPHLPIESDPKFMAQYPSVADDGTKQHHGNITQLDHAFGKLMRALDRLNLSDDTFVVFTSDNGPEGNGTKGRTRGSTGGLRGRKRAVYEGGIRVPGLVRWPGRVEAGSVSATPVIGSDIFATVCDVTGTPMPDDRVIDGTSMVPAFAGRKIRRVVPMYWRYHGAPHGLHMAMRDGDYKILASTDQTKFELYNIAKDPQETDELSTEEPERFAAMKAALRKLNTEIEAEGPDWFQGYGRRRRGGWARPLTKGEDKTSLFDIVKGCTVTKGGLGFQLEARGEGFAVRELLRPIQKKATFVLRYKTLAVANTKNAMLVFGDRATNANLVKCGTAIGMGNHCVFQGSWNRLRTGTKVADEFKKNGLFEATVTVDLESHTVTAEIGGKVVAGKLPPGMKRIRFYGYYVKGTNTTFSPIGLIRQ